MVRSGYQLFADSRTVEGFRVNSEVWRVCAIYRSCSRLLDNNYAALPDYIASDIYKFHKDTLLHVFGIKLLDENPITLLDFETT